MIWAPLSLGVDIIVRNDDECSVRYPGGKFRCYQKIVSLMPPHQVYIETHLGGGAVFRHKLPARENIGIDRDAEVISRFTGFPANYRFILGDSLEYLSQRTFVGSELVYADPPYPPETRRAARCYRYDYSAADHQRLLSILKTLPCAVMVSSYPNELYDHELAGWHRHSFRGTSHVGARTECVWTNFEPGLMHDTRFIGWTFHGRQAWRRKTARWQARFAKLSRGEQQAMLLTLQAAFLCENSSSKETNK